MLLLFPPSALGEFGLPEQDSGLYYRYAVVAGEAITALPRIQLTGDLFSNGTINLKLKSHVEGDVSAVETIRVHGTVSGTVLEGAESLSLSRLYTQAEALALANRVFHEDTIFVDETIDDVVFVEGEVRIRGSLSGNGTIIANGDIRLARPDRGARDGSDADSTGLRDAAVEEAILPAGPAPPDMRLALITPGDIAIGRGRSIRAALRAGGDINLEGGSRVEGVLIADREVRVKRDAQLSFVNFDETPPSITQISPADGDILGSSPAEILVQWSDDFSGVDPTRSLILLDGSDRTSEAAVNAQGLTLSLTEELIDGPHSAEVSVQDFSGKVKQESVGFVVQSGPTDTLPPTLGISKPQWAVVREQPLEIRAGYFDSGSGIDPMSIRVALDGVDLSTSCEVDTRAVSCIAPTLASGSHSIVIEVSDLAGNMARTSRELTVVTDSGMQSVGLASQADTSITELRPDESPGRDAVLQLGGVERHRALVRFDSVAIQQAIGPGLLSSARLELFVESNEGNWGTGGEVSTHSLRQNWVEPDATWSCPLGLDSGAANQLCEPSWSGGDFEPEPSDSVVFSDATTGWVSFDVTADVLALVTGSEAFGWLLRTVDDGAIGAVSYSSREGESGQSPRLVLEFEAQTGVDTTPPQLRFVSTPTGRIRGSFDEQVVVEYLDLASDVDLGSLQVTVDGEDKTGTCMVGTFTAGCTLLSPTPGSHTIAVGIRDSLGNLATIQTSFEIIVDSAPPSLSVTAPGDDVLVNELEIEVTGSVSDDQEITQLTVEGQPVEVNGGAFSTTTSLREGSNIVVVEATDSADQTTRISRRVTLDTRPPDVRIEPAVPDSFVTGSDMFSIGGQARDLNGLASVELNGTAIPLSPEGQFQGTLPLAEGSNTFVLEVRDQAGNITTSSFEVIRFTPPDVSITSPVPLAQTSGVSVSVAGTVSPSSIVSVQGVSATVSGNTFVVEDVPLTEGTNILTAVATDAIGRSATSTVMVTRDSTAPRVVVTSPTEGALVFGSTVTVTGLVNAPLSGLDAGAGVEVNGVAASVVGNTFIASGVPIQAGDNLVVAEVFDGLGNRGEGLITVRGRAIAGGRLEAVAGDLQVGAVGTPLPEPLVVRAVDAAGNPVTGVTVLFSLRGNNGSLGNGQRREAVTTDGEGLAQTTFTLGSRAGAGQQRVTAVAAGFASVDFHASALPVMPAQLFVDSGDQQVGCPGQPLPMPLVAVATDAFFNRVAGTEVVFRVVRGDGVFDNGQQSISVVTDSNGQAPAVLTAGSTEGSANNVVRAELASDPGGERATFVASTLAPLEPEATSISGLVLDNTDVPIPGVTVSLEGESVSAQTDETGFFRIQQAPVGTVHLLVDGTTSQRPGPWPILSFELVTVPGRDNTLGRPIPLVQLETRGVLVGEDQGGTVTLSQFPGFALDIAPGSVTFPDGTRSGEVSVTVVHNDKVPMVPNFGQQPRFVISIQPSDALFDPPARLTLPNVDGLEPGRVTEMYSFDHDAERFISIGTGTTSDDGTVIASDPGVGVVKAGWHCGGDPASSGTPHACLVCWACDGDQCVPISDAPRSSLLKMDEMDCDDENECTDDFCRSGDCVHEPLDDIECDDDGNNCTRDVCEDGTCTHPEIECDECMTCDSTDETGACIADPEQNGMQCMDEGDPSCSVDRCAGGTCTHTPLNRVGEFDPDPIGVDRDGLTEGTQEALECFEEAVAAAEGTIRVNSAFRPDDYQNHLRQVWFRYHEYRAADAAGYDEAECADTIDNIESEWRLHRIVAGPPRRTSNHSDGTAFDATVSLPPGNDVDELAAECGLNRPDPVGDRVHFEF